MPAGKNKPMIRLTPDGTIHLNAEAARQSGFDRAKTMSVFYSEPKHTLMLAAMPFGTPIQRISDGSVFAKGAADFLEPLGALPSMTKSFEARCGPNLVIAEIGGHPALLRRTK